MPGLKSEFLCDITTDTDWKAMTGVGAGPPGKRSIIYVTGGKFDSPHNAAITWKQLLQQTSEWEGILFGKPDTADFYHRRGRTLGRQEPGTYYEYNDVRVNLASYSLLRVWEHP